MDARFQFQAGTAEVPALDCRGLGRSGQLQVALGDQQLCDRGDTSSIAQQSISYGLIPGPGRRLGRSHLL